MLKGLRMTRHRCTLVAVLICVFLAGPVMAAELGDPAPPLKIKKWIKGEAVDLAKGKEKNIYVVEFWATWCGPCRMSIPHLTEMQKKFKNKGVVFIGISDESATTVEKFVKKMGDRMDYRVAVDDRIKTNKAYMAAFGIRGIPHAFVVNKSGQIAWQGHPMNGLEQVLGRIVAGTYDVEKAKLAEKARKLLPEYFELAAGDEKSDKMEPIGRKIFKYGRDDAGLMNEFAWTILTHPAIEHRDLKLARRAAKAANDVTQGKDTSVLETYARALFDTGEIKEAVRHQRKAVELAEDGRMKRELKKALKRYEKKLPKDV